MTVSTDPIHTQPRKRGEESVQVHVSIFPVKEKAGFAALEQEMLKQDEIKQKSYKQHSARISLYPMIALLRSSILSKVGAHTPT